MHRDRRPSAIVIAALLGLFVVGSAGVTGQAPRAGAPNILIIQADDLGYGDVSAYGQSRFQTPNIDRLARNGIRFTQY